MLDSPLLRSPDKPGIFDPVSNSAGLSFDLEDLLPRVVEPTVQNWRKTLQAFHEWAHFYQFATTSYGFLYRTLTFSQILLLNGLLSIYPDDRRRIKLPILSAGERTSFEAIKTQTGPMWTPHLRFIYRLEWLRRAIFGYAPFPLDIADVTRGEYYLMQKVLKEIIGTPEIYLQAVPDDIFVSGAYRFRIDDLLESHAHALSSLWLMQAVQMHGLPRRIIDELLDHANEVAVGPYAAFLQYQLPSAPKWRLQHFCFLCDIALNPPGLHYSRLKPETAILLSEPTWSPVERLWRLVHQTIDGAYPVPNVDYGPGYDLAFLQDVKKAAAPFMEADKIIPFDGKTDHVVDPLFEKAVKLGQIKDVPISLLYPWIDTIETFVISELLRKDNIVPLILGGRNIRDLETLFGSVAGPNVYSHVNRGRKFYPRVFAGLIRLGFLDPKSKDFGVFNYTIAHSYLDAISAIKLILYRNRQEIERVPVSAKIVNSFLEFYKLRLSDFD